MNFSREDIKEQAHLTALNADLLASKLRDNAELTPGEIHECLQTLAIQTGALAKAVMALADDAEP